MRWFIPCLLLLAGAACDDAILPEGDPAEPVEASGAEAACAAACDGCDDENCVPVCRSLHDAMEPQHVEAWLGCFAADACTPGHARQCMDGLDCADDELIATHCDTLARCGLDGRGWLDEADCRAHPYHEASRWGCLKPERRQQVGRCLWGAVCGDLGQCLNNAVCLGDGVCNTVFATTLTVDCHRMCDRANHACDVGPSEHYNACWQRCDRASRYLADEHRRTFETCGLEAPCAAQVVGWGTEHVHWCIDTLECDAAPLRAQWDAAEQRCAASMNAPDQVEQWACLGHVIQSAIGACLDGPCADLDGCMARATSCEGDPYCLMFFEREVPGRW